MTKETYLKMTESFRGNPKRQKAIILIDSILTKIAYIAYPVLLAALYLQKDTGLARAVLVPGISFVVISVFRYLYCAPRPYEVFDLPPVIPKDTRGKSFPSRHVFSIFIIGMTFFWKMPLAGVLIGAAGIFMAVVRVLGGVHFPKDVIAGAALGILAGLVGFYWIP
ncbi:MAG: phosphatase PAP2 family protein [Clostridiales Family XIII bacterium]|uniref:phosphatase PAP2 family protein n=1 Tax=Hominibacterium faecale TaxID=2839743 RepID=UPI0022B299A2|nr:phosphatase PAP2 family protein [Hominibacterium faecale]MCI7300735.1 phosphatase PAP2 family protein [Clostridia bacterium]MDY3011923.1 phosphatase PAP2 family protein [Clostridiales Family XIII bacterium]